MIITKNSEKIKSILEQFVCSNIQIQYNALAAELKENTKRIGYLLVEYGRCRNTDEFLFEIKSEENRVSNLVRFDKLDERDIEDLIESMKTPNRRFRTNKNGYVVEFVFKKKLI